MLQGMKQMNLKEPSLLQSKMKTLTSKPGSVENTTNIAMKTEDFDCHTDISNIWVYVVT